MPTQKSKIKNSEFIVAFVDFVSRQHLAIYSA